MSIVEQFDSADSARILQCQLGVPTVIARAPKHFIASIDVKRMRMLVLIHCHADPHPLSVFVPMSSVYPTSIHTLVAV